MNLIDIIYKKYKTVSIVGMAKNAGKTVTLNKLIEDAYDRDIILGITSIGRDGESKDIVTNTEKPMIYVPEGSFVATLAEKLDEGDAKLEIIRVTEYKTPMGEVVVGRVRCGGYLQIAGPQTNRGIKEISDFMLSLGAEIVLIDGAIDRLSSASPSVSEGTILATGAVISRDMNRVIEDTVHTVRLFSLESITDINDKTVVKEIMEKEKIGIVDTFLNIQYLDIKTAINSGKVIGSEIKEDTKYVVFPGALVGKTLIDIISTTRLFKQVEFIVRDGTKIFISPKEWLKLVKMGVKVKVLEPINTLAVTVNPYSPQGYYFDSFEFLKKMRMFIKDIPVFDVMLGDE
ncbi:hypothetical protein Y919_08005 [Caloranaerobacter azorensis H53214]|uniref:Uncharacterized protein n=1 Tax=Caloranaerobacter azorensis H53214 TaxID=1156417 RepID=A0A096BGZ2_9FIRM|nr:hypothetical protein [Caloranaerobacter azorensis]KGG80142.1 hypothetical protein Y919_08005 [Caloranaerobacter azorensis H53214]